ETVIDLRLTGRLNLNRIELDQELMSGEIQKQGEVFAVSIDLTRVNVDELIGGADFVTDDFSREELEKAAISALVRERYLWGLDHRADEISAFFYELKEAVRLGRSASELAEKIAGSPLLEQIVA